MWNYKAQEAYATRQMKKVDFCVFCLYLFVLYPFTFKDNKGRKPVMILKNVLSPFLVLFTSI